MNLQVETLDTHEVRLTISIDQALLARARQETARQLSKQLRIPGFRPGHAPVSLVVQAVGGEDAFNVEVVDRLMRDLYPKALDQAGIEPYAPGQIEEVRLSAPTPEVVVRVPLEPTVELKDYRSIRLPFPEVVVSEADVENELQALREENAILQMVERAAAEGDAVEVDLLASDEDGKPVFRVRASRPFVLDPQRVAVPGLVELIVGMSAGEHKEATLTMPEDFEVEPLRGKTLQVVIDLHRVNSRTLPELDDALAQTIGNYNTLDELREKLRNDLLEVAMREARRNYQDSVIEAFTTLAEVKMPPAFLEDRLNEAMRDLKQRITKEHNLPFEEWLKLEGKTEDQLRQEMQPSVERRARASLVLTEVARAEHISVSDAEINEVLNDYALRLSDAREADRRRLLSNSSLRREMRTRLLTNRVLERMTAIARGEVQSEPAAAEAS